MPASRRARRTRPRPHRARARQPGARDGRPRRQGARRLRDDLVERRKIYQELIDRGVITLTTNKQYERFTARLDETGAAGVAASHDRAEDRGLMSTLNPERVFRIRVPLDEIAKRWQPILAGLDAGAPPTGSSTPPTRPSPAAST